MTEREKIGGRAAGVKDLQDSTNSEPIISALSFEEGIKLLEELVSSVESGTLPLEKAVSSYEKGVALISQLRSQLSGAEQKLKLLQAEDVAK